MSSVTRKTRASRKERRAAIEQQLLGATERLMGQGTGLTKLSVDQLASEAGMSRATFYVYFEDKGQLLRQLAQQVFVELDTAARAWWDVADRHRFADIYEAIARIIVTYREHASVLNAVIEMAAYDAEVSETYDQLLDGMINTVVGIIERGQGQGQILMVPVRETATALTLMMERTCHQVLPVSSPDSDPELTEALAKIVWHSLYLHPVAESP